MRKRVLPHRRAIQRYGQIEKYTRLMARSTFFYTVFTALALAVVGYTTWQQRGFNQRQLELYELTSVPQVFVVFDSLSVTQQHNVFYHVKNVGNSPALGVRSACIITSEKENPLEQERKGELNIDLFPGTSIPGESYKSFKPLGTCYLHFRVDFHDLRGQRYFYRATYYLVLELQETPAVVLTYSYGIQSSEYGKLGF